MYKNENIKKEFMFYTINACKFFMFHNIYCIFWTSWVFHRVRETIISYIFGFVFVLIINILGLDRLFLFLLDNNLPIKFSGKEKNKIYEKTEITRQ